MAFILILSPNKAPPVFLLEGSTEIIPMFFSGKSPKNRRTNSSTKLDFPEPPVPVIPRTGISLLSVSSLKGSKCFRKESCLFSAREISLEMVFTFLFFKSSATDFSSTKSRVSVSTRFTISLIIPWSPISRPSSGE